MKAALWEDVPRLWAGDGVGVPRTLCGQWGWWLEEKDLGKPCRGGRCAGGFSGSETMREEKRCELWPEQGRCLKGWM